MLAAVKGYYDGTQIIVNEDDRKNLNTGDELIITILNEAGVERKEARADMRRGIIASKAYVTAKERTVEDIDNYIRGLRNDDRF